MCASYNLKKINKPKYSNLGVQVNVWQQSASGDEQVPVKTLSKGDWFGEQALKG